MSLSNALQNFVAMALFLTANIANAVVGQNDIDDARFITLPFDEIYDSTGLLPNSGRDADNNFWPEDICESVGGGFMHYKYKPAEDQMINIIASGDDTEIRVINADDDLCVHSQDSDNLNYFLGDNFDGVFVPETDGSGNYIPASDRDSDYVGEAPHWYQEVYFSDPGTCDHGCSEDTEDEVTLTANTTYIIQIAANYPGRQQPDDNIDDGDNRGPTFVSIAVGGVGAAQDRPTPSTSVPVPTLPLFGFGVLVSLLGLLGLRKLSQ